MNDDDAITAVRARLREVEEQIPRHEIMLAYLKKERDNLAVALQVLENIDKRPSYLEPLRLPEEADGRGESSKPDGVPTVPLMIIEALLEAQDAGQEGLRAEAITKWVRERYWPDAPSSSIGPTAWRMSKDGRLTRAGELYALASSPREGVNQSKGVQIELGTVIGAALLKASQG